MSAPRDFVTPLPMSKEAKTFFAKVFINPKFVDPTESELSKIMHKSTTFGHVEDPCASAIDTQVASTAARVHIVMLFERIANLRRTKRDSVRG